MIEQRITAGIKWGVTGLIVGAILAAVTGRGSILDGMLLFGGLFGVVGFLFEADDDANK